MYRWVDCSSSKVIFTSYISKRGNVLGTLCVSACLSGCLYITTLEAEPSDRWTWNLVGRFLFNRAWMSSKVKVIGQRSSSQGQKCKILIFRKWGQRSRSWGQGQGSRGQGQMSNIQPTCSIRKWGQRSRWSGQGHEVKVTEANLSDVITVRCGEREVHQCWCIFLLNVSLPYRCSTPAMHRYACHPFGIQPPNCQDTRWESKALYIDTRSDCASVWGVVCQFFNTLYCQVSTSCYILQYIVACRAHPALVKRSGVRTVFISLLVNWPVCEGLKG